MILKLLKWFIMALFGATVCSAAYLVPWYENDMDVDEAWGNANANTVCTAQINPQTCWANDIAYHIFTGNPATCYGVHVTSAIRGVYNVAVLSTNPNAGLMEMEWYTAPNYGGRRCQKSIWNDIYRYPPAPTVQDFTHLNIQAICQNAIATTNCVSTPLGQGIIVGNQYGGLICVSFGVGGVAKPGITCFPRINTPAGAIGDPCY